MTVLLFAGIVFAGLCVVFVLMLLVCGMYFLVDRRQMRRLLAHDKPSTEWAEEES